MLSDIQTFDHIFILILTIILLLFLVIADFKKYKAVRAKYVDWILFLLKKTGAGDSYFRRTLKLGNIGPTLRTHTDQ